MLISALLISGALVLGACGSGDTASSSRIDGNATLRFSPLEGGCWYLVMDDTDGKFLVSRANIPTALRLDGFRFSIQATVVEHVGTVCQFGTPVRADKLIPLTNENALVDLSVSGSGTIYGSPCIINGTDHGLEWKIQSAVTESLSEYLYVSNLEPGLQEEGLEVSFEGAFRNDVDPFCHQGRVINTTLIEPVL